jgi:hypothetical protein
MAKSKGWRREFFIFIAALRWSVMIDEGISARSIQLRLSLQPIIIELPCSSLHATQSGQEHLGWIKPGTFGEYTATANFAMARRE